MVYNAMKLFMEINPQLFDDCSHDYTEHQNSAPEREATRMRKWDELKEKAERQRATNGVSDGPTKTQVTSMPRLDEMDPATEDNQKRLDSLKLQDGSSRRPNAHDRQSSQSSARSR